MTKGDLCVLSHPLPRFVMNPPVHSNGSTAASDTSSGSGDWLYDLTVGAGARLLQTVETAVGRASLVGDRPFHEPERHPAHFAWTRRLEANWQAIRRELDAVLEHRDALPRFQDISRDQRHLSDDDDWKTFFLYGFGHKAETNCARCPETTALVESVPGMKTAFFSILSPGKHIPAHRGPYKGVLRYHLGLKVPQQKEQCRLRVADEYAHWEEGEGLLFDDTYDHEVWNDTDEERAILFMDVERPLRFPLSLVNKAVIAGVGRSPFVQDAKKNQEQWAERFAQAAAETDDDEEPERAPQAA
jgi:beta-hydroxylase